MLERGHSSKKTSQRLVAGRAACRVEAAGVHQNVYFCLMDSPQRCRHAVRFGFSFICLGVTGAKTAAGHSATPTPHFEGKSVVENPASAD